MRSLVDEVACLHESLTRVREELRKEKRANAAAKGKKARRLLYYEYSYPDLCVYNLQIDGQLGLTAFRSS